MKVKFWGTSTVTAVETKGRLGSKGILYYVTLYRLEISLDCATFKPILDDIGNTEVICGVSILLL